MASETVAFSLSDLLLEAQTRSKGTVSTRLELHHTVVNFTFMLVLKYKSFCRERMDCLTLRS